MKTCKHVEWDWGKAVGTPYTPVFLDDDNRGFVTLCDECKAAHVEQLRQDKALHVVVVPPVFYDDHVSRDLPAGLEIKRDKKGVEIIGDLDTLLEIRSDARHYVDHGVAELGWEYAGLISSARATVKRITAALKATT